MRTFAPILAALTFAVSPLALAQTAPGPATPAAVAKTVAQVFSHKGVAADAERYEAYVKDGWKAGGRKAPELISAGDKTLATDPRAASRTFAQAVVADDKNAQSWLGLARALLAIKPNEDQGSEKYDLPVNASAAAYRAYERAGDPAMKAKALAVLGEAMQRRAYWRPAIDALKTSLAMVEDATTRVAYEKLRAEHGFRMTDYKTDSEAATPRVCVQFSEVLSRVQSDFAKFVSLDGKDPQSVAVESQQLCVDGLTHGQRYEIQVRAGLPSDVGDNLEKPVTVAVYVPDRKPFVRFSGKAYVLPSRGQQGIPVVSVNTERVELEVFRIGDRSLAGALVSGDFDRQLSGYDIDTIKSRTGERVYQGEMDVASKLNDDVTTAFPVSDAIGQLKPGAYAMIARPAGKTGDDYSGVATQWFIVSDLGLTGFTGKDGIHAFVRSLSGTEVVAGANVKLIAKNNEILATGKTDAKGYVKFDAGQTKGEGGLQPAVLAADNGGTDYAFLDLTSNAFDLSDRGVQGREQPGPIDAYVYTERGVYRPGEEVNVTTLVRDNQGTAQSLPVTLIVSRPDGVEHGRYTLQDQGLGGRSLHLPLNKSAQPGTWRAKLHADPKSDPITQVTFLVEDYVPERLDLTLDPGADALSPDAPKSVKINGRYLYGPPAAGLAVEGEIIVKESQRPLEGYAGYKFGLSSEQITAVRETLDGLPKSGEDGSALVPVKLPAVTKTARPLEANVILRLREDGGRTIERTVTVPVDLKTPRIGIKPVFGDNLQEGEAARFEVVMLDAANKPVAKQGLRWDLVRLETSWQWYNRDNSWNYEAQTIKRKVANGTLDTLATGAALLEQPTTYGRYRLEVASLEADGPATSVEFNAGWYAGNETAETPEALDVALDKKSYKPGDVAKLRIASKTGGKALVSVLGGGLLSSQEIDVPKGGGDVDITVGSDWGPGAYATALLYRPMDEAQKRMPSRALGVAWVGVDQSDRTLKVSVPAEAKVKSGSKLTVPVKIEGLAAGEEARITVAAVDVGILNLTKYQAPAPEGHFYAQRKLGIDVRDFYGRLIDGMRAERGKLRQGGDGMALDSSSGTPPVEDTVAFYSGIVTVGADGTSEVSFDMPDFNGTVRLMAVAWSKSKLGHGTQDVIVRDQLALTASAPRFITLGDEATLDLSIHNVEAPAGAYRLSVAQQPLDLAKGEAVAIVDRPLSLKAGERLGERFAVKPTDVGLVTYDVRVTGDNNLAVSRRLSFNVMPPAGDIKRTTVTTVAANGGKLTLSPDLMAGMIASRTKVNVSVGPAARLDVAGLLTSLDRYPYGCAEQTVSRAMPLVVANSVAAEVGLTQDAALKERIEKAIEHVFELQDSSGAFSVWGGGEGDIWLTSYVTDFLTRAKDAGHTVRPIPFNQALDRLANYINNAQDFESGGEARAYALYVLARNARAPVGELRYYADTRLERFGTPLAKAQLGAALSMVGDKERAERSFQAALAMFDATDAKAKVLARDDYGSTLRDGAALVALASETGLSKSEAPRLVNVIAKAYQNRTYTSTQEQAWMLLAAKALQDQTKSTKLSIGGNPVTGSIMRSLTAEDLAKGLVISNDGDSGVDAVISVIGSSLTAEPPIAKGFKIERQYYTLDGKQVDLQSASGGSASLNQNDRLVAVVKIESDEAAGRVLLVDHLPAGLEIENPKLVDGGDVKTLPWLKSAIAAEHSEFRDDRFVAAFDLRPKTKEPANEGEGEGENPDAPGLPENGAATAAPPASNAAASASVAYIVRAVTPGKFIHPAATIEDMYRPERYARTAAGTLTVVGEKK
jgi:alpha-2-macroglobulin